VSAGAGSRDSPAKIIAPVSCHGADTVRSHQGRVRPGLPAQRDQPGLAGQGRPGLCGPGNAGRAMRAGLMRWQRCGAGQAGPDKAGGAPREAPPHSHVRSGLPSVHLHCRTGHPSVVLTTPDPVGCVLSRPPPAAGRAWVPGCRARTLWSVFHFYDGSIELGRPWRNQFVIFIDAAVHMSTWRPGAGVRRRQGRATRAQERPYAAGGLG